MLEFMIDWWVRCKGANIWLLYIHHLTHFNHWNTVLTNPRLDLSVLNTLKKQYVGTKGGLVPPQYLKKKLLLLLLYIYIYRKREGEIVELFYLRKWYIYNIFTTNFKWEIIIGCYRCAKKLFKCWLKLELITTYHLRFIVKLL